MLVPHAVAKYSTPEMFTVGVPINGVIPSCPLKVIFTKPDTTLEPAGAVIKSTGAVLSTTVVVVVA